MNNPFKTAEGQWNIKRILAAIVVIAIVVVIILAATGVFDSNGDNAASSDSNDQRASFTWHPRGWIDRPYTDQMAKDSREACETDCIAEPNDKCVAYAWHTGAKRCYFYDRVQPNEDTGIRTDINYSDTYPWGIGMRN